MHAVVHLKKILLIILKQRLQKETIKKMKAGLLQKEDSSDKNDAAGDEKIEKSSVELVKYYEEIRPKVTAFLKRSRKNPTRETKTGLR